MKKITLALVFLTIGLQAQDFPSPYCDIDESGTTVEEITEVNFADVNITNANASLILIDKTASVAQVSINQTYTVEVFGNTAGPFDTDIVAFIDWNGNELLDDAGEIYEVGTLSNSTGSDGISVSLDITVPEDVQAGETRIRITKIFTDEDSVAIIDPCAISFNPFDQGVFPGFGQALDFTLNVETLSTGDFNASSVSIYPNPVTHTLHIENELVTFEGFTITDIAGRIIQNILNPTSQELNVTDLQSGVYFLSIRTTGGTVVKKFIKQ